MKPALALALVLLAGCIAPEPIYPGPRDGVVTIFVPGIQGSVLVEPDEDVAWISPTDALSEGEKTLVVPFEGMRPVPAFEGPLEARGPLTELAVPPIVARDVYLSWLEYACERLPGFEAIGYDWRRDAEDGARLLAGRIEALARKDPRLRVNVIAHSFGGLVTATLLQDPSVAARVERVVYVGVPFGGCASVLRDLQEGTPILRNRALLSKEALFTFASTHQCLPPPGKLLEAGEERWPEWGVFQDPSLREDPAYKAQLERMLEARRRIHDSFARASPARRVLVVSGTGHPTIERVRADLDFAASPRVPGDGRVTVAASLPPAPCRFGHVLSRAPHEELLNDSEVRASIASFLHDRDD